MDEQSETAAAVTNLTTLLASGFGVGLSPVAPGTVGSLLGIVAIVSAERAGKAWGVMDHPAIVIDEVVGVWLAVLVPLTLLPFSASWPLLAVGAFLAFRLYDIVKPWPVNVLERRLPGGWGVVLDDLAAGAMAGMILTLALLVIGPA
jgi:phosphatidylglycerophosphatase A